MRDRLIELLKQMDKTPEINCPNPNDNGESCKTCQYALGNGWFCNINARKADYLLANGVILLHCKVGDSVYQTDAERVYELEVFDVSLRNYQPYYETESIDFDSRAIGKTVFLTKEEAEKALAERGADND